MTQTLNYFRNLFLCLTMLFAASNTFAQAEFGMKLNEDGKTYTVSVIPNITQTGTAGLSLAGQVTILIPVGGFKISNVTSIAGEWSLSPTPLIAPSENAGYEYQFFNLVAPTQEILYQGGVEVDLFTFENTGACTGETLLLDHDTDPLYPDNQYNANVGNLLVSIGTGSGNNAYSGNYIAGNKDCASVDQNCEVEFEIKLLADQKTYSVALNSFVNWPPPIQNITSNMLITIRVPTGGFSITSLTNKVSGASFTKGSEYRSPAENPAFDYISFNLNGTSSSLIYNVGSTQELFTFQNNGTCGNGTVTLAVDTDPFILNNLSNANARNQITTSGGGIDIDPCEKNTALACTTVATNADDDGDGVLNINDICPNSVAGASVNAQGCTDNDDDGYYPDIPPTSTLYDPNDNDPCIPVACPDNDGDGIPDDIDICPNTLSGATVNAQGCTDNDGDGYYPDIPQNHPKYDGVDTDPCIPDTSSPTCNNSDSDNDGVFDIDDRCPNSAPGATVNALGCTDVDNDGYYPDADPNDPKYDPNDANPCVPDNTVALCDSDNDNIPDGIDNCPNSAAGAIVNAQGCTDADGDGYFPDTDPTNTNYDPNDANACIPDQSTAACQQDEDGDGIPDDLDLCPNTPSGTIVSSEGCEDRDSDGYYPDLPSGHPKYDPIDTNPCEPDNTVAQCDDDLDGIVNGFDDCPFSAPGASVDGKGCTDDDQDGFYPDVDPTFDNYDPEDDNPCVPNVRTATCDQDTDGDGVLDRDDLCLNTPPNTAVNALGCSDLDGDGYFPGADPSGPSYDPNDANPCVPDRTTATCDDDNDGVPNGQDDCPFTVAGATVNSKGCTDDDNDGFFPDVDPNFANYDPVDSDPCVPNSSSAVCDTDQDGIPDGLDSCPFSPLGVQVNANGCSDLDNDGYFPGLPTNDPLYDPQDTNPCIPDNSNDQCDTDGDGIIDAFDDCPLTQIGAPINTAGCTDVDGDGFYPDVDTNNDKYDPNDNDFCIPVASNNLCDADGDGVINEDDICPNTPPGAPVSLQGCSDVDQDGYYPGALPTDPFYDPLDTDPCIPDDQTLACRGEKIIVLLNSSTAFLQGAYDCTFGLMRDDLREAGLIPLNEPYTDWIGTNGEKPFPKIENLFPETLAPSVLEVTGDRAVVDWIHLRLRSAIDPSIVQYSRNALLLRDGEIVDIDGTSPVQFLVATELTEFYLEINHRNHLGVMTDTPLTLTGDEFFYNFSLPSNATWGSDAQRLMRTSSLCVGGFGNVNAMWGGDANADGFVVMEGAGIGIPDEARILEDVLLHPLNENNAVNFSAPAYLGGDTNMDAMGRIQGLNNDFDKMIFFNILDNPNNPNALLNYVIRQQIPE